jgi:hypothetical protein
MFAEVVLFSMIFHMPYCEPSRVVVVVNVISMIWEKSQYSKGQMFKVARGSVDLLRPQTDDFP